MSLIGKVARWGMVLVAVGAALNLALAWQSIRGGTTSVLDSIAPGWLVVAALLGIAPWGFNTVRIWMWARFLEDPISMRAALRANVGTELASSISPKAIGGAPAKVALIIAAGVRPGRAASMLLLDNLADVIFFAAIAPAIAFATARWQVPEVREVLLRVQDRVVAALPWIGVAVALLVVAILVTRWRASAKPSGGRFRRALAQGRDDFVEAYALIGKRGKLHALMALALTSAAWLCRASVGTAVIFGLGQSVDPILFFLLQWVVFAVMVLVPTPGAALGAEASFAAVLDGFVIEGLLGILTAGWRLFAFYLPLVFGLIAMPMLNPREDETA